MFSLLIAASHSPALGLELCALALLTGWVLVGQLRPSVQRFLTALIVAVSLLGGLVQAAGTTEPKKSVAMLNSCDVWGGGWIQWACENLGI